MPHRYRTVEDLLQDDSFINYCLRKNGSDIAYWQQFIRDHPDKQPLIAEAEQEFCWLFHSLAQADLQEQLQHLKSKVVRHEQALDVTGCAGIKAVWGWRSYVGVAAAVVLLPLIAGIYFLRQTTKEPVTPVVTATYECLQGERKSFQLPDGTQVVLNAGSSISLNTDYAKRLREVFLKGEAFFEVQHNATAPFIVHTPSMDVKALGTAFNVRSYNNEYRTEAVLVRGLVEVTLKKDRNRKLLLHPDEKLSWADHNRKVVTQRTTNDTMQLVIRPLKKLDNGSIKELAWVQNNLTFDDETFEEIAWQLNRWYNVEIQFAHDQMKQYHFTATFKKEKLGQALDILKASKHFQYRYENEHTIVIY
jgi:transmembrane sensor